jgi:hypothetical protein
VTRHFFLVCLIAIASILADQTEVWPAASEHPKEAASCMEFAPAVKQVDGKTVGIEECRILSEETVFNIRGHRYRRLEIRISGTVDGWALKEKGPRSIYFTDGPDFVFVQSGHPGKRYRGIAKYEAAKGSGMTLLYPDDPRQWNGKLFVTAHGGGAYGPVGALLPRDGNQKFNTLAGVNRYIGLMVDKGYAVAHTMRSASRIAGDIAVSLEDGTTLKNYNLSAHGGLIISWTKAAESILLKRFGAEPRRVYFYGHSAGGFLGRLINYQPGLNADASGKLMFHGFLLDDSGGGLWLPKLVIDGRDVLFTTDEDRRRFVKQIDITHQLYLGEAGDYLAYKRENARILKEKGLGEKHRVYEIRGVSHFDAGQVSRLDLVHQSLDLGGIFDALIDRLDEWVEKEKPPPPSKADALELGDTKRENPAIALPEITCPLGVYHIFPRELPPGRRGGQETAFAAFDGINLEPLDSRGVLVDMNGNGLRDRRETVVQAWQRLGLLKPGQKLNRDRYKSCVQNAVSKLVSQGLLPEKVGEFYIEQAAKVRIRD